MNITWEVIVRAFTVTLLTCGIVGGVGLALKWLIDKTFDKRPWVTPVVIVLCVFIASVLSLGSKQ